MYCVCIHIRIILYIMSYLYMERDKHCIRMGLILVSTLPTELLPTKCCGTKMSIFCRWMFIYVIEHTTIQHYLISSHLFLDGVFILRMGYLRYVYVCVYQCRLIIFHCRIKISKLRQTIGKTHIFMLHHTHPQCEQSFNVRKICGSHTNMPANVREYSYEHKIKCEQGKQWPG